FGLASMKGGSSGAKGGTRSHMAPELFRGAQASAASDLYALGVVFHEMLTGQTPPWDETPASIPPEASTATVNDAPAGLDSSRRCAPLPAPWNAIVARCLAPAPAERFHTADEIADRLRPRHRLRNGFLVAATAAAAAALAVTLWTGGETTGPPVRL